MSERKVIARYKVFGENEDCGSLGEVPEGHSAGGQYLDGAATAYIIGLAKTQLRVSVRQLGRLLGSKDRTQVYHWSAGTIGMSQKYSFRLIQLMSLRGQDPPVCIWDAIDWTIGEAIIYEQRNARKSNKPNRGFGKIRRTNGTSEQSNESGNTSTSTEGAEQQRPIPTA